MDKKEALKQIKAGFFYLASADKKLKGDKEVVLAAVKQNVSALDHASKKLKADKELILMAAKGGNLKVANVAMRKDKKIVLAAVNIFGGFLVTQRMLKMYKKKKKK